MENQTKTDSHISKPHDHFFKVSMADKRVAKEFFESHLPKVLQDKINLETLELKSGTFIDDLLQESIADMLFETKIEEKEVYLYLLVDHQSRPDALMPFRILKYTCNIIAQHLRETGEWQIPFVFPMVVYHG